MKEQKSGTLRFIIEVVVLFAAVIIGVQLLMHFVISKDVVQGTSMQPTLEDGDRLYSARHHSIDRNDIVVIDAPDKPGELYIKRVIGMPGDTVAVKHEKLYINGKQTKEPYLKSKFMAQEMTAQNSTYFTYDFSLQTLQSTHRATVPKGAYFVMGDNRLVSHDGRDFGFIAKNKIQSVVVWRYWPLNKMKIY
ncbi:signal peptidase I [Lacticaseibacillus nasuensis]|uniref:signal peptidase I n=1 Tax=Lacticaseibacillus nasuensis TaxID=944671 RepID=UPI002245D1AA|nr:signal peptidase I [Lacticaseibacillus nasuensis]MCX2455868.1 signal peptidase I [Lacticaseibacillus nasuensis]